MQSLRRLLLFSQLPGELIEKRNHEFYSRLKHDVIENREMVLVDYKRTWTFGLCSFFFLFNAVTVRSLAASKKKDLVYVSDGRIFQKNYRFEDFFWTGSEDDAERENSIRNQSELEISLVESSPLETWRTTTIFHTTTILFATLYPNSESCLGTKHGCTPKISPVQTRKIELSSPTIATDLSEILPCPTQKVFQTESLESPNTFLNHNVVGEASTDFGTTPTTSVLPETKASGNEFVNRGIESDDNNQTGTTVFPHFPLDQRYWVTTILRSDNFSQNLQLNLIENKLSTLYKKALRRRQEKYFGGTDIYDRKDRRLSQVKVNILNVTKSGQNLELLYYVSVADQPVPAMTAANDMRLLTASEVIAELGYPILSKAEPHMRSGTLGARVKGRTRDTWLFVGSVIAAILLLMILAALFALELSKKRSKQSMSKELEKRKHVFQEEKGTSNLAFEGEVDADAKGFAKSGRRSERKAGNQSCKSAVKLNREKMGESTSSSCSSSEASLVRLRHQQRRAEMRIKETEGKSKLKPRTRVRKVENSGYTKNCERTILDRAGSAISRNSFNQVAIEGHDDSQYSPCLTRSPTSYLSMPSVKAFPRGTQIPESLNKILEPISIRHLDADTDSPNEYPNCSQLRHKVNVEHICEVNDKDSKRKAVTRHASLEGEDPGFIGPIVWNRHCQKVEGENGEMNLEDTSENVSVGRMRKRFNELLDDALSMFGSRNPSPDGNEGRSLKQAESRVYSAAVRPAGVVNNNVSGGRPKTTGSRRPQSAVILGPRGAWETPSCSTLARSDTATVFHKLSPSPNIDKNLIYVSSDLAPNDPAVTLIAAIKSELKKFQNPQDENF